MSGYTFQLTRKLGGVCSGESLFSNYQWNCSMSEFDKRNEQHICRRLDGLDEMGICLIVIFSLMILHISSFAVWCTGVYIYIYIYKYISLYLILWIRKMSDLTTIFFLSDGVDEYAVNRFLSQVFSNGMGSPGKVHSIVKEAASRKFDMKEEVLVLYFSCINPAVLTC